MKQVRSALLAIFFTACNPSPPGVGVYSFVQAPLAKEAKGLTIDWLILGQPGQLAIANVLSYGHAKPAITAPPGWTLIRDDSNPPVRQSLYWHAVNAKDSSRQTWTFSEPVDAQGAVVLLNNADRASPVDAASGNIGGGNHLTAKSVTTGTDNDFIMVFYATDFEGSGPGHDTPYNMSTIVNNERGPHAYWILGTDQRRTGNSGDALCSAGQYFNWIAVQVAIKRATEAAHH